MSDEDKEMFLSILHLVIKRYGWKCYAYCLMNNHYHLLIETPRPNLSLGMRQLNGVYTQAFNRKHKKTGHVFQGRFKAFVVEKQNYLMVLSAYIVLNPVRAKMVKLPEDWQWSSYRAAVGQEQVPEWLDVGYLADQFGGSGKEAIRQYQRFVADQLQLKSPWDDAVGQMFIGEKGFVEKMCERVADRQNQIDIPGEQRHAGRPMLKEMFDSIRSIGERNRKIVEAHIKCGYKQSEIAKYLSLHYVTVSRIIKGNS